LPKGFCFVEQAQQAIARQIAEQEAHRLEASHAVTRLAEQQEKEAHDRAVAEARERVNAQARQARDARKARELRETRERERLESERREREYQARVASENLKAQTSIKRAEAQQAQQARDRQAQQARQASQRASSQSQG
jgi:hypothetical protein